jgi:WD40 repeat protein
MADTATTAPAGAPLEDGRFQCGTLRYTKAGLFGVFSWLLWGDLCFTLFESAGGPGILSTYLQQNFHVNNLQVFLLFTLIPNLIGTFMTPIISFKSDRTRTRWGRRIPYMALTAPFLCFFAAALGFSDDIINYFKSSLADNSWMSPLGAAMCVIGLLSIGFAFFNEFVGTVYWYLFADVVPQKFLGRFMALFRMVGFGAGLITGFVIGPNAISHMKIIHVGVAALYFLGFGLMCWRVKEGEYPPVTDVGARTTLMEKIKLYFRECFTHPIFVWFYLVTALSVLFRGLNPAGIFNLHLRQHVSTAPVAHAAGTNLTAATTDGSRLVSAGTDGKLIVWRHKDGRNLLPERTLREAGAPLLSVAVATNGLTVAAGTAGGDMEIWDADGAQARWTLAGHTGGVRAVSLSAGGALAASAADDGTVRLWDLPAGTCRAVLTGHAGPVHCLAFSSDGRRLASGGADGTIRLWDAAAGTALRTIERYPGPVYAVAFLPALEKRVVDRGNALARTWNSVAWYFGYLFSNESVYDEPADGLSRIAAADGWIAAGGSENTNDARNAKLRIWNLADGALVATANGHKKAITSILYKPDIRMLLTGSLDTTMRLWNPMALPATANDQAFKTLSGYTHAIQAVAGPACGLMAVNSSADGTLHVWDLDKGISLKKGSLSGVFFTVIGMILAYPLGALVDRLQAIRVILWMGFLGLPFAFLRYFFQVDYLTSFWIGLIHMPLSALSGAAHMPMQVTLLPRAKYGQFCSANALVKQFVIVAAGTPCAWLLDRLTDNTLLIDNFRYGFLFQGLSGVLSLAAMVMVYRHWKKLGGPKYVAPET